MPTSDLTGFTERLLALLDSGRKSSTYKYALLLALIDAIASHTTPSGRAPRAVAAGDLAPRVIDLYWQQTRPWPGSEHPLRQNSGGQAEIVRRVAEFRESAVGDRLAPFGQVRNAVPAAAGQLVADVRWKLIQMPIPKMQRAAGSEEPFIYTIGWDDDITRGEAESEAFDDRLVLVESAGEHLLAMAPLIRPLVQRSWALEVAKLNHLEADELEQYLFDPRRLALSRIHGDLRDLQSSRCFYCREPVASGGEIDHFIPWSRHFDNSIQNLVFAHGACNNSKRAFLASSEHLQRWIERTRRGEPLEEIATRRSWESRPGETLAIARGSYLKLSDAAPLWSGRGNPPVMEPAEPEALRRLFAAGR